ncbi:hypothetical protein [Streptomyces cyaneofuscatus]
MRQVVTVNNRRCLLVQCTDKACELTWASPSTPRGTTTRTARARPA